MRKFLLALALGVVAIIPAKAQVGGAGVPYTYVASPTINCNSATTDTIISPLLIQQGFTTVRLDRIEFELETGSSNALLTVGVFTATGGGGNAIVALGAITVTQPAADNINARTALLAANTALFNASSTLYFRVGAAAGVACTGKVILTVTPVPGVS